MYVSCLWQGISPCLYDSFLSSLRFYALGIMEWLHQYGCMHPFHFVVPSKGDVWHAQAMPAKYFKAARPYFRLAETHNGLNKESVEGWMKWPCSPSFRCAPAAMAGVKSAEQVGAGSPFGWAPITSCKPCWSPSQPFISGRLMCSPQTRSIHQRGFNFTEDADQAGANLLGEGRLRD